MKLSHVGHLFYPFGGSGSLPPPPDSIAVPTSLLLIIRRRALSYPQPIKVPPWVIGTWRRRVPATPFPIDILDALRLRLLAAPSLSSLVDVYLFNTPPSGEPFPCMVLNPIRETLVTTNSGSDDPSWAEIQFTVIAEDELQGYRLREAAFYSLHPKKNPGRLLWQGGADSGAPLPVDKWSIEQMVKGPSGSNMWVHLFSYKFHVTRAF